jgi:pimeloyl-ACP methyl ester carboxylesterase
VPRAHVNDIEIEYETFGEPNDPALLLIMGLGGQLIAWDESACRDLAERGLCVVRFDNRDAGLSTRFDEFPRTARLLTALLEGDAVEPPYTLSDMAGDAVGLLDHLGIERAHVVGASMGGMIAQHLAFEYPDRVASLTSIMSTSGPGAGSPTPEARAVLFAPTVFSRDDVIEQGVAGARITHGPIYFEEDRVRERIAAAFDRGHHPEGTARQLVAILADGDRSARLGAITAPTLVIHGAADPLVTPSGGEDTAARIPGARLEMIPDMGHDIPVPLWPRIIDLILEHIGNAA